ncbi:GxxExxY protein [Algoriphagus sp. AGSA1]|uniref:GxxExxY protein n=1 Tax=Algoriphagus sp. AGSA1 TaxID=2907213 RepID=UPI001F1DD931|nr:GxxExxY protein [Algoriphagus sp. AGSA1]
MTQKELDELTYKINGAAFEVHKHLDPGLLESVYQKCLAEELRLRNISFQQELILPIVIIRNDASNHIFFALLYGRPKTGHRSGLDAGVLRIL